MRAGTDTLLRGDTPLRVSVLRKKETRDKFSRVRASLQRKGTKGAKRALKRLSGRERKYQTWLNHTISRAIISSAKSSNAIVAIEDLTGIRERTNQASGVSLLPHRPQENKMTVLATHNSLLFKLCQ